MSEFFMFLVYSIFHEEKVYPLVGGVSGQEKGGACFYSLHSSIKARAGACYWPADPNRLKKKKNNCEPEVTAIVLGFFKHPTTTTAA